MHGHIFSHPVELLNTLLPSGLPPHKLVLKVGAPVVFIRNLNREQGIMNGTRGVIQSCPREIAQHIVVCTLPWVRLKYRLQVLLTTGPKAGTSVAVPRINLSVSDASDEVALHFIRRQFPVRQAYCMAMSMRFIWAYIFYERGCFNFHDGYLSRPIPKLFLEIGWWLIDVVNLLVWCYMYQHGCDHQQGAGPDLQACRAMVAHARFQPWSIVCGVVPGWRWASALDICCSTHSVADYFSTMICNWHLRRIHCWMVWSTLCGRRYYKSVHSTIFVNNW